jgi:hypothetical protein
MIFANDTVQENRDIFVDVHSFAILTDIPRELPIDPDDRDFLDCPKARMGGVEGDSTLAILQFLGADSRARNRSNRRSDID